MTHLIAQFFMRIGASFGAPVKVKRPLIMRLTALCTFWFWILWSRWHQNLVLKSTF